MTEIPIFPAGGAPSGQPEIAEPPAGDLEGLIRWLGRGLHGIRTNLPDPRRTRLELAGAIWPVRVDPVPVPLTGSAGFLQVPQLLGPGMGENWDIHTISATGFSAGSVSGWIDLPALANLGANTAGALRFSATAAGFANYGKNQLFLRGRESLSFIATGITGIVLVSIDATAMRDEYVGEYLK